VDVASAVRNALKTGTDAAQLRGFGNAISKRGYPIAGGLLLAKANTLTPTPTTSASPSTYKVRSGDSASKIAASFVHDGTRWKELVAANPNKKRAHDGNFASLLPGEVLQLPASWTSGAARPAAPQGGA
jgi:LysM repeat protein